MTIRLTPEQWADAQGEHDSPPVVSDPMRTERFVLVRGEVYEQYRASSRMSP